MNGQRYDNPVYGIDPRPANQITFLVGQRSITVAEHFKRQGIRLEYPNGPVLILGQNSQTKVPAEVTQFLNKNNAILGWVCLMGPKERLTNFCIFWTFFKHF